MFDMDKIEKNCKNSLMKNEGHEGSDTDYSNIKRVFEFSNKSNLKKEFKYIKGWEDEQAEY
jgi:hypothetical protein